MAKIEATGNLGADAEVRFTKSGAPVLSFRLADSKSRKTDSGEWEKVTEQWLNVSMWDDAEHYAPLLTKGARVTVWGEFYARKYDSDNGGGVSLDVRADAVKIHPKRNQGGGFNTPSQGAQNVAAGLGGQPQDPWSAPPQAAWGNTPSTDEPPF